MEELKAEIKLLIEETENMFILEQIKALILNLNKGR